MQYVTDKPYESPLRRATVHRDRSPKLLRWYQCGVLALSALIVVLLSGAASAETDGADPIDALVEEARASGLRVIILDAGEIDDGAAVPSAQGGLVKRATELAGLLVLRFNEVIDLAPAQYSDLSANIARFSPVNSATWPFAVGLTAVAGMVFGHIIFAVLGRFFTGRSPPAVVGGTLSRRERVRHAMRGGLFALIGLAFEIGFGLLVPIIFFGNAAHTNAVISTVVEIAVILRVALIFFAVLLQPDNPSRRLATIGDDSARRMYFYVQIALLVGFVLFAPVFLLLNVEGLPQELMALSAIIGVGGGAAVASIVVWVNRDGLTELFSGGDRSRSTPLTQNAWILLIIYFLIAWLTASSRMLLDLPNAFGLVGAPFVAVMLACVVRGFGIFLIARIGRLAEETEATTNETTADVSGVPAGGHWLDEMTRVISIGIAVIFVLNTWGVGLVRSDGSIGFIAIAALTLFLAYAGWTAIRLVFDRKIAEEIGDAADTEGDEGGGAGVSRLGTLLPLFRNVILFGVLLVALMVMLIELGVDIAPLFAGAGILGLAIGFGAQTLIRDIFSGLFFLIDDAFRTGEYVETGNAKGTVERISIRSMQLRHHNGPLHTIPFGEIQQLTNFSRDWVIMKLPLRLTLDTDPERVRKMIKKLGQELLDDPMAGDKFLQPLKSQGVLSIDNFGMVVRVKFMTRPGDQFITRRVVYARIHELFEREGIEFASRDVRIRMDKGAEPSENVARAATVAAELAEEIGQAGQGSTPGVSVGGAVSDDQSSSDR